MFVKENPDRNKKKKSGLSSTSPQANKVSSIKTKRNPKLKQQKTGAATRNDVFLKYLAWMSH